MTSTMSALIYYRRKSTKNSRRTPVVGVLAPLIIRAYRKQNKGKNKKLSKWFNLGK